MSDSYLSVLEFISDPWALFLISFLIAGVLVVVTAITLDPRPKPILEERVDAEDFFDRTTRYHDGI